MPVPQRQCLQWTGLGGWSGARRPLSKRLDFFHCAPSAQWYLPGVTGVGGACFPVFDYAAIARDELRSAPRSPSIRLSALTSMLQFAVFFSDGVGFGMEMVQALDTVPCPGHHPHPTPDGSRLGSAG